MSAATITPYLMLGGRCQEALDFYRDALGAELEFKMLYSESPHPAPPGMLQEGFENKIMHASFRIRGALLMASDGRDDKSVGDGVHLVLSLPTEADVQRACDALAQGGTVEMPPTETFWSPCFGMVTDRFKIGWMISVPGEQPA
jgi:PhnB protein